MMRSLFSAVSGLKSHQTRMDVIGNNIANVNTNGFKSSRATFADMLSQTQAGASAPTGNLGGTNPKQIGLGVSVASTDLIFNDTSAQQTGKNTDLALSGNGLFVVKTNSGQYYTRDGNFTFDALGNYVMHGNGGFVQGWMADANGTLTTASTPGTIRIPSGKAMDAAATTKISYNGNLNSSTPTIVSMKDQNGKTITAPTAVDGTNVTSLTLKLSDGTTTTITTKNAGVKYTPATVTPAPASSTSSLKVTGIKNAAGAPLAGPQTASAANPLTLTLSDGSTWTVIDGAYDATTGSETKVEGKQGNSVPATTIANVYDSLGNLHKVLLNFEKVPSATTPPNSYDKWRVSLGATEIKEADGSTTTVSMTPVELQFDYNGKYVSGSGSPELTLTNGAGSASVSPGGGAATIHSSMTATVDLSSLTQYSGSNTQKADSDGHAAGTLKEVSVDASGIITGTYTNGVKRNEAQVAIAQFNNASGLTKTGGNFYQESNNSGVANIKTASDLGCSITPSALEMSNVDIANEFSDMIITQRGFQSNSKIITVDDEMLETVIGMKR